MIAFRILCRIEEQDIVIFGVTSYILYERNCGSILVKLHAIARRKLVEAALFVCEPFAQFRGYSLSTSTRQPGVAGWMS